MDQSQFSNLLNSLNSLTRAQQQRLLREVTLQLNRYLLDEQMAQRSEQLQCPTCHSTDYIRWGQASGLQRYRCKACGKTFNVLSDTPFARVNLRHKLSQYAQCMEEGLTLREAARRCGINLKTAFHWRHRFLSKPREHKASKLSGIVEADETFFRESFKGNRQISHRKPRKHGRRDDDTPLVPVLIVLDRSHEEADFVLDPLCKETVQASLQGRLTPGSVLCTDGSQLYREFAHNEPVIHKRVIALDHVRVVDEVFHIQTLNQYVSALKGWMIRFHGVGTAYLENYLAWWRLLAQNGRALKRMWLSEALS